MPIASYNMLPAAFPALDLWEPIQEERQAAVSISEQVQEPDSRIPVPYSIPDPKHSLQRERPHQSPATKRSIQRIPGQADVGGSFDAPQENLPPAGPAAVSSIKQDVSLPSAKKASPEQRPCHASAAVADGEEEAMLPSIAEEDSTAGSQPEALAAEELLLPEFTVTSASTPEEAPEVGEDVLAGPISAHGDNSPTEPVNDVPTFAAMEPTLDESISLPLPSADSTVLPAALQPSREDETKNIASAPQEIQTPETSEAEGKLGPSSSSAAAGEDLQMPSLHAKPEYVDEPMPALALPSMQAAQAILCASPSTTAEHAEPEAECKQAESPATKPQEAVRLVISNTAVTPPREHASAASQTVSSKEEEESSGISTTAVPPQSANMPRPHTGAEVPEVVMPPIRLRVYHTSPETGDQQMNLGTPERVGSPVGGAALADSIGVAAEAKEEDESSDEESYAVKPKLPAPQGFDPRLLRDYAAIITPVRSLKQGPGRRQTAVYHQSQTPNASLPDSATSQTPSSGPRYICQDPPFFTQTFFIKLMLRCVIDNRLDSCILPAADHTLQRSWFSTIADNKPCSCATSLSQTPSDLTGSSEISVGRCNLLKQDLDSRPDTDAFDDTDNESKSPEVPLLPHRLASTIQPILQESLELPSTDGVPATDALPAPRPYSASNEVRWPVCASAFST